jgi:hypothetical protein
MYPPDHGIYQTRAGAGSLADCFKHDEVKQRKMKELKIEIEKRTKKNKLKQNTETS